MPAPIATGSTIGNAIPTTESTEPAIEIALPAIAILLGLFFVIPCEISVLLDVLAPILIPRLFV